MRKGTVVSAPASFPFVFHSIRRISAPEDTATGRVVWAGHAPAESYLGLPDHDNVREYIVDAEGKKKKKPTDVHLAMRETLENTPENFSILNGGIVIAARHVDVDENKRTAHLRDASILNGSQTQGELERYIEQKKASGDIPYPVHVKFELIETEDEDLIAEVSIARNFQNDVMTISIAGRLRQLDELEQAFQRTHQGKRLQKSETDLSHDVIKTEKLLQVIVALTPPELWPDRAERHNPNKVFAYSMKSRCLKSFQKLYEEHDKASPDPEMEQLYQFYLDICGEAWGLYAKWKAHQGFIGTYTHGVERENGEVKDVPDGMIFPILAALSAFAVKRDGRWTIAPPANFQEKELILAAVDAYKEIADRNPQTMGKSKACYSSLYQIASIYRRLSDASQ